MIKKKCFFRAVGDDTFIEVRYMVVLSALNIFDFYDAVIEYEAGNNCELIAATPL